MNPDICGLGSCTNNDDGTFYQCDCQDGAEPSGADATLTCVGRYCKITFVADYVRVNKC